MIEFSTLMLRTVIGTGTAGIDWVMNRTGVPIGNVNAAGCWLWTLFAAMAKVFTCVRTFGCCDEGVEVNCARQVPRLEGVVREICSIMADVSLAFIKSGGDNGTERDRLLGAGVKAGEDRKSAVTCCWALWLRNPWADL